MTPRSDPHTETIREALTRFVPDGFRDDDGVWHDGPHRVAALAALAALESEIAKHPADLAFFSDNADEYFAMANTERARAVAAEARVTQLEEALRDIARTPSRDWHLNAKIARSALGVVADGGGGRDE